MERITIGDSATEYYANINLWEEISDGCIEATGFICARGKGEQMMLELVTTMQALSSQRGLVIKHIYTATNQPSLDLINRLKDNLGYTYVREREVDNEIWIEFEKTYYPSNYK